MKIKKPLRVSRTKIQKISAEPSRIFPLLCPVREADWADGWDPKTVITSSGFAEQDSIFITNNNDIESIWVISKYLPEKFTLEMIKTTPGVTAAKINISLKESMSGFTNAKITYQYTSLSDEGDRFVYNFNEEYYNKFIKEWEEEMNYYLSTGKKKSK